MVKRANKKHFKMTTIPCTVVGDNKIGKSWMTMAFAQKCFPSFLRYTETFLDQQTGLVVASERQHTVKVFDTTGRHDQEDLRKICYKQSEVIMICFSVVNRTTFANVRDFWIPEIQATLGKKHKPILLVGCQTDLRHYGSRKYRHMVRTQEGENLAKANGLDFYMECSAMSLTGVREVFENVAWSALKTRASQRKPFKGIGRLKSLFSCVTV